MGNERKMQHSVNSAWSIRFICLLLAGKWMLFCWMYELLSSVWWCRWLTMMITKTSTSESAAVMMMMIMITGYESIDVKSCFLFSINFIVWKFILLIASIKITLKSHMRKQSFWLFISFHSIECLDSIASVLCSATDIENAFNWEKLKEFPLKATLSWWICTWQVRLAIQLIQFGSIQFKRLKF